MVLIAPKFKALSKHGPGCGCEDPQQARQLHCPQQRFPKAASSQQAFLPNTRSVCLAAPMLGTNQTPENRV